MAKKILIASVSDDLHGLLVSDELRKQGVDVYYLNIDKMHDYVINWDNTFKKKATIVFPNNRVLDISRIPLIWWRRVSSLKNIQENSLKENEPSKYDKFTNKSWPVSLRSILLAAHTGKWISSPSATESASNKIHQLEIAREVGFRTPRTLVSNNPQEVKEFALNFPNKVIIKPLVSIEELLFTQKVDVEKIPDEDIAACPCIYQEYIEGTKHLRINVFGKYCYAAQIETSDVDWRPNLNVPITSYELPRSMEQKLQDVLKRLNLEMGIFDFKISESGEYVWFEVNPQGQFLFLEPLTNQNLLQNFVNYLIEEMNNNIRVITKKAV